MTKKPTSKIEILRDKKGIYGITPVGFPKKWAHIKPIILRPDRVIDVEEPPYSPYQSATPKECCKLTDHSLVNALTESRASKSAEKRGLAKLPPEEYCALRVRCGRIVHSLMEQVLAVANPAYLRTARQYPIVLRFPIYKACCLHGDRVDQISNTFPLAAVVGYTRGWRPWIFTRGRTSTDESVRDKVAEITKLVQEGAGLTVIAKALELSKLARYVCPANIDKAPWESLRLHPNWFFYMPRTIHEQLRWLYAMSLCDKTLPGGYSDWVAHHALELGDAHQLLRARIRDWSDWVCACHDKSNEMEFDKLTAEFEILVQRARALGKDPRYVNSELFSAHSGTQFVTRKFTPNMSVATVRKHSDEWHEAISMADFSGEDTIFPAPWYEGGEVDGCTIIPIRGRLDLYREGRAMHNCSLTYADRIINNECFFYSVAKGSEREATLMVSYVNGQAVLGDLRTACNGMADPEVTAAVNKWLTMNQRLHASGNRPANPDA